MILSLDSAGELAFIVMPGFERIELLYLVVASLVGCSSASRTLEAKAFRISPVSGLAGPAAQTAATPEPGLETNSGAGPRSGARQLRGPVSGSGSPGLSSQFKHVWSEFYSSYSARHCFSLVTPRQTAPAASLSGRLKLLARTLVR